MRFKVIILTMLIVSILTLSAVSANDNLTDTCGEVLKENSLGDLELCKDTDDPSLSSSEENIMAATDNGTFTALQNKIDDAPEGSTITLENDYVYDEGFAIEGVRLSIEINKSITIIGNGHTIDGQSHGILRITYDVKYADVVLDNITFINGNSAINSYANHLTVRNCIFSNNKNSAINSGGEELTVESCIFNSNNAYSGGAINIDQQDATIINSSFNNNRADEGGAIYMATYDTRISTDSYHDYAHMSLENCTFSENTAEWAGGAVYCICVNDMPIAKNCTFKDNLVISQYSDSNDVWRVNTTDCKFVTTPKSTLSDNSSSSVQNNSSTSSKTSKQTPKIIAKAKTFKKSVKTKKYKITLKTNQNKVMKSSKVTLKVNGKTYTAKTNSKGVATFKITKLTKKGKYTATVSYAGSKNYNAKTVKAKIIVK